MNIGRYVVIQQQYNLLAREVEWEVSRKKWGLLQLFGPQKIDEQA